MTEEFSLPTLPRRRPPPTNSFPSHPSKRTRFSSPDIFSSDPPMFSSDDDPAAENYISRDRPKKVFRGPWYNHKNNEEKTEGKRERTSLRRQFDSAVCIGSDGMEDSDAEFSSRMLKVSTVSPMKASPRRPLRMVKNRAPSPEEIARTIIEARLDENDERIDLSQLGLTTLSNSILQPLSTFIKAPSGSQTCDFTNLRPALKIFLSSNRLERLPASLFHLEGLSVLSLRSNRLVEIPACVGRLHRLQELNVAFNALHYLPFEILNILLDSSRLQTLTMHPNQFYEPLDTSPPPSSTPISPPIGLYRPKTIRGGLYCIGPASEMSWSNKWDVKYRCRSQVRFLNTQGYLIKGPQFPEDNALFTGTQSNAETPGSWAIPVAMDGDLPQPPATGYVTRALSLVESAVRTYSQSTDLPIFSDWNNGIDIPSLSRLTHDSRILRESEHGGRKCTVCSRKFFIPRTEWIEWWEIARKREDLASAASPLRQMENKRSEIEKMIPLVRRGCSWACVPTKAMQVDE